MTYKVLITTSGLGSRLGEITKYTNKSLVRVGKKPVLAHIIDKYSSNIPLVITIGHHADQIIEFCKLAYPDRDITFVIVDNYDGPGSSLGYSMLAAKEHLQQPFIFHAGDTIIEGDIPSPENNNWSAGFKNGDSSQYTSFVVQGKKITRFLQKGSDTFDYLHIGLVGIKDYELFWKQLTKLYNSNPEDSSLNDVAALKEMISVGIDINCVSMPIWYDIGNVDSLKKARQKIPDKMDNLDKVDEAIYLMGSHVIKFFYDEKKVAGRLVRARVLGSLLPNISSHTKKFYKYEFVQGNLLSEYINTQTFKNLLDWLQKNLFQEIKIEDNEKFNQLCKSFYKDKTLNRLTRFYQKYNFQDKEDVINGEKISKLQEILKKIDFDSWLCQGLPGKFHGDLHFNNIIQHEEGFTLLDWRENFAGIYEYGDIYYDLAKIYHGLIVNHPIIQKDLFTIKNKNGQIFCDLLRPQLLVDCEEVFLSFLKENNYDTKKVKILTALIYLNIAVLHHHPYDKFLYYFGKQMLHKVLQ